MPEQLLSLVIPVFNEEEVLEESFRRMDAAMRATGHPYEIIYVNDGSRDNTMEILRRIAAEAPQVRVLSFSRNFGHQLAVTCGMDAARGSAQGKFLHKLILPANINKGKRRTSPRQKRSLKRQGAGDET